MENTFQLVRSHRRTIAIHVDHSGRVIVKAPHLVPLFIINRFMKEKKEWVEKQIVKIKQQRTLTGDAGTDGSRYLFLGKFYPLKKGRFTSIGITDTLNVPEVLAFRLKKELTSWYIAQAKTIITQRVEYFSGLLHAEYKSVTFSDTDSKWGSCSFDNRLQFTWRLIMAPITIIDYVVIHELVHTRIKNHSAHFWKEVAVHKPAYKQYIKWLRQNSSVVHAIVPK